ncbi:alpha/beta hydrolase [Amycolatopsis suaedae]|uniref:Alpha/beta hydrolase n=1 Tax=Amycolatopsis suaedae TaxID=2510978 RepID=A0A4Q7JDM7_9PSEU|nr:alpha/beta hydrolase [Amycolatopsis suaedae]RZQ65182.1 alpha/beta hydrolase [Amycolatopsis suaedae]
MRAGAVLAAVAVALPLAAVPAAASPAIDWRPCPITQVPDKQCGSLAVADPAGTVTIELTRLPARDRANRVGVLLTNPGGPGGSGVDTVGFGGLGIATPEFGVVRDRFDIIGWDPRGVGHSKPAVTCDPATLYRPGRNFFPRTKAEYDRLAMQNRAAGEDCLARTGPLLDRVDTGNAADDIEDIRVALGEEKINWLGLSYGTELGAVYASKYPQRVRAMVLDGAADHGRPTRQVILEEAAAGEQALNRFAAWCAGAADCALRGRDVLADHDRLMAQAEAGRLPSSALDRPVTAEEASAGVYGLLGIKGAWPVLSQALAKATDAQPDAKDLTAATVFGHPSYAAYRAVGCHDFPAPFIGAADMRITGDLMKAVAPRTWRYVEFWDFTAGCVGWPVRPGNPPQDHPIKGTGPILVASTTHDPATPLAWARGLAGTIENSALLIAEADGHTATYNSACARSREAEYLVSGNVPADLRCREQAGQVAR